MAYQIYVPGLEQGAVGYIFEENESGQVYNGSAFANYTIATHANFANHRTTIGSNGILGPFSPQSATTKWRAFITEAADGSESVDDDFIYEETVAAASAGTPLTAQQTRDAMMLAPTAGSPGAGSVDELLGDIQDTLDDTEDLGAAIQSSLTDQGYTPDRAENLDNLDQAVSDITTTIGQTIDPSYVGPENKWRFDAPDQMTASNIIRQSVDFDGLIAMDSSLFVIPQGTSLSLVTLDSVYVQNSNGDYVLDDDEGLEITTPIAIDPDKNEARMQTLVNAEGTYRVIVKFVTTDNQAFFRRGVFIAESKVGTW